jgi:putative addiction module CopG family antidote
VSIVIPPELETRLRTLVQRGRFRDTTEALGAAVRLLEEQDQRLDQLRAALRVAADQAAQGEVVDFTPELLEELSREAEERSRRREPIRDAIKP